MALSASRLSTAIRTNLAAKSWVANNAALTELCDSLATAIVAEIAQATITISPLNAGLQTSAAPGSPTAGPAAPVPIDGAIS